MWMTDYIGAIKRRFRDVYGFVPTGGTELDPVFAHIPDGEYPMTIDGKLDAVRIVNGAISCCHFTTDYGLGFTAEVPRKV